MTERITLFDGLIFVVTVLVGMVDVTIVDILIYWAMKLTVIGPAFSFPFIYILFINIAMFTIFGIFAFIHVRKKYFGMALFLTIMPIVLGAFEMDVIDRFFFHLIEPGFWY
jgi:hypothetical protein